MRPRLILHAGTHKTGTTAIQKFAAGHRPALRASGLFYPRLPVQGAEASNDHHSIGHAFATVPKKLSAQQAAALFGIWREGGAARGETTFVSTETVWRHVLTDRKVDARSLGAQEWMEGRRRYVGRLADALEGFEVETIVVFRDPVEFVRAVYAENIHAGVRGLSQSFTARLEGLLRSVARYGENARLFAGALGRVRCLEYDALRKGGLIPGFFRELGHAVEDGGDRVVRRSMSPARAHAVNIAKGFVPREATRAQVDAMIAAPEVAGRIDAYEEANPGADVWASGAERVAFIAAMEPQMAILEREFAFDCGPWRARLAELEEVVPLREADGAFRDGLARAVAEWWRRSEESA